MVTAKKTGSREAPRFRTAASTYLRARRRLREISVSELGRVSGLSSAFISMVERGCRRLSKPRYVQLLRALKFLEREHGRGGAATLIPPPPPWRDEAPPDHDTRGAATTTTRSSAP